MKTLNKKSNVLKIAIMIAVFFISITSNAQIGNKLLEKAAKAVSDAGEVTIEGDMGKVYVYKTAERKTKITDITGLNKIYCTAYVHEKAAKKAPYTDYAKYGLWQGSDCDLNGGGSCKRYHSSSGSEKVTERNAMNGGNKLSVAKLDFEIDLLAATEWDVKHNNIPEDKSFYVVLDNNVFLSISDQLTFDIKASSSAYEQAAAEKNKDLKMQPAAFSDAPLEAQVKKLFVGRSGVSEVKRLRLTSGWSVETTAAGIPKTRSCQVSLSCKEDGQCKFYSFMIWEKYQGGGNWELPTTDNDFYRYSSQIVPCENL